MMLEVIVSSTVVSVQNRPRDKIMYFLRRTCRRLQHFFLLFWCGDMTHILSYQLGRSEHLVLRCHCTRSLVHSTKKNPHATRTSESKLTQILRDLQ